MPENAGVIVRTAAEGAAEEELPRDVTRLAAQWEAIERSPRRPAPRAALQRADLTIRVIRDMFDEDFGELVVSGDEAWDVVDEYVKYVAPHLAEPVTRWQGDRDAFAGTASTNSSPRRSSARSGCPAAVRWSSTRPRP